MDKRLERDIFSKLLSVVGAEKIGQTFFEINKGIKEKFEVTDPVLKGMLNTFIYKIKGGADLRKSKSTFDDVFKKFYNNFKPY